MGNQEYIDIVCMHYGVKKSNTNVSTIKEITKLIKRDLTKKEFKVLFLYANESDETVQERLNIDEETHVKLYNQAVHKIKKDNFKNEVLRLLEESTK